jgi:hypothetical protein
MVEISPTLRYKEDTTFMAGPTILWSTKNRKRFKILWIVVAILVVVSMLLFSVSSLFLS